MRRFGIAAVLGLLFLTGGAWGLAASDTPKVPRSAHRRKAVVPRHRSKADVTLEDLYVDAEIGQVFSVDLGRADQSQTEGNTAGSGVVHVYQLSGSEEESPARVEVAGLADPDAAGDDEEGAMAESEAAPAGDGEAMDDAEEDPAAAPVVETAVAAPEAAPQADPAVAKKTPDTLKDKSGTPPPAASFGAPSPAPAPPPPPIR
ncbi:MAG TPA: hypothetical protein VIA62_20210 [Thermoanaerobaculia bacterium]|jgi:hypothetical protein|nr:hypothetical protein [Thermoanaerobaculia bacterium]